MCVFVRVPTSTAASSNLTTSPAVGPTGVLVFVRVNSRRGTVGYLHDNEVIDHGGLARRPWEQYSPHARLGIVLHYFCIDPVIIEVVEYAVMVMALTREVQYSYLCL